MRLDQAQQDLFCAIANDENRTPHSMPGWYYSDPRLFEIEKTKVFADGWICVGHQSEILKIGQYETVTQKSYDQMIQTLLVLNVLPRVCLQLIFLRNLVDHTSRRATYHQF